MKVIVGLGNPGKEYIETRHNLGFKVLEKLAQKLGVSFKFEKKFKAEIAEKNLDNEKVLLAKPQTFMNNSGESVLKIVNFYKITNQNLIIVYDDIDLDLGEIRETGKSSAGHKGAESILNRLGTNKIRRYRVGIKNPNLKKQPIDIFVLQKFSPKEKEALKEVIQEASGRILKFLNF
jgi:PTH1 family peptidyl-tRNA hydrolase